MCKGTEHKAEREPKPEDDSTLHTCNYLILIIRDTLYVKKCSTLNNPPESYHLNSLSLPLCDGEYSKSRHSTNENIQVGEFSPRKKLSTTSQGKTVHFEQ